MATALAAGLGISKLTPYAAIFESMVEGGVQALPAIPRWLHSNQKPLFGVVLGLAIAALGVIWVSRKENWVAVATVVVAVLFLGMAILFPITVLQPLRVVIDRFQE